MRAININCEPMQHTSTPSNVAQPLQSYHRSVFQYFRVDASGVRMPSLHKSGSYGRDKSLNLVLISKYNTISGVNHEVVSANEDSLCWRTQGASDIFVTA